MSLPSMIQILKVRMFMRRLYGPYNFIFETAHTTSHPSDTTGLHPVLPPIPYNAPIDDLTDAELAELLDSAFLNEPDLPQGLPDNSRESFMELLMSAGVEAGKKPTNKQKIAVSEETVQGLRGKVRETLQSPEFVAARMKNYHKERYNR